MNNYFKFKEDILILSGFFLILLSFSVLQCNDVALDINYQNPCFEKDIVPLVKRDCSRCHENGEYKFKVIGSASDYQNIIAYVDTQNPDESLFLKYALGKKKHPKIWNENSKEYIAMYNWISNGAKENCIDESLGECQSDEDCAEISCICEDLSVVTATKCYIDENGAGICANDNNCTEPIFGLCKSNIEDAGEKDTNNINDTVIIDSGSDINVTDISAVDTGVDTGIIDSGYDTGIDSGYDTGIDVGYDTGIKDTGNMDTGYDSGIKDTGFDSGFDAGTDTGNTSTVSFSAQIVPLIKTDCRSCHYAGQYGVKLTGTTADYSEVMRYVDINNPEAAYGFLWWAAGGNGHPNKWPKGGTKYNLFLKWVKEGAKNN